MHNPESVLENETHKLLWGFEIQTNFLNSVKRLDRIIVNKKMTTNRIVDTAFPVDFRV